MTIIIELDVMLARRKMKLQDLAAQVGITIQNLSILKTGKAKAIRLETLNEICRVLECQPGDLLRYEVDGTIKE
jgi:putative transcriptional regulator